MFNRMFNKVNQIVRFLLVLSLTLLMVYFIFPSAISAQHEKYAVIVIDDFGNNMSGTKEMMELKIPFTAAVMPFLPTTKRDAQWAHQLGHEVLVHLPMEPLHGKKNWLGPGAITTDLRDAEIRQRVSAAIDDVPFAVGINNHMGSKATADPRVMRIVLQVCHERGLFFLDSRTNYKSVVARLAREIGVPTADNKLFFDEQYNTRHISKQVSLFKKWLIDHDECVAIGHVGPPGKKTADVLKHEIPKMDKGIHFVSIGELLSIRGRGQLPQLFSSLGPDNA